jgi:hypothetical protein
LYCVFLWFPLIFPALTLTVLTALWPCGKGSRLTKAEVPAEELLLFLLTKSMTVACY